MPRHKGAGKKSNVTINHDDPRMIHLRDHFDYLHKFGEVKATKVIATVVDGARGLANRQDTDGNTSANKHGISQLLLPVHGIYWI